MSSTSASAVCATTSPSRAQCRPRSPVAPRPPSLSVPWRSGRAAWSAGASPNSTPVSSDSVNANSNTRASTATSSMRGVPGGVSARSTSTPQYASTTPVAPPTAPSATLSVSSCLRIAPRPAPIAARSATSRSRPPARASSRFAMLTHAITSSRPTAPMSASSAGFTGPASCSCSGTTRKFSPAFSPGYCSTIPRANADSSDLACSTVLPGAMRASTRST